MRYGILGAVTVWDARGGAISVGGPRVRSLLALLVLNAGSVVPVETLIDGLYGDDPPAGAGNALQSQVSRLRRALRGTAEVEGTGAGYRIAVDPQAVDAHRFLRLVAEASRSGTAAKVALLDEALGLWRGEPFADAPELRGRAVLLEETRTTAIEDRAAALLELGAHRDLVAPLRELVAAHPLRERPAALLMRALHGSGRQSEALELYERTRRALADELGADPSPELAKTHLSILRGAPEPPAPAPTSRTPTAPATPRPASGPRNPNVPRTENDPTTPAEMAAGSGRAGSGRARVPAQFTSFVGRDVDLVRVAALLGESRLVTLTGPGGVGKTRLAIEAGERGGAVFVDFAAVAAGEGETVLARAVMGALGLREAGVLPSGERITPVELLTAVLGERPALLIFDNCEHVVGAAATLTRRLLGGCPGLRVLATSREALGITGEALWPVRQLPVPDDRATLTEAVSAPAVRLFIDRGAAVNPDFTVTAANLEDVVRICEALDGQPLAIELAAARLRSLAVTEIADRLDDRFRLLSRGDRTQNPRHRTLRAVVEWSWGLLGPDEQRLARRLSVFTGGFTAAAAGEVCGGDEDLLLDLADRSLLQRTPSGRYRMLQTIFAYCSEQLEAAGEQNELRRAHAVRFLVFAREADTHLCGAGQLVGLERLDTERENLRAALRWALGSDTALAFRLLSTLSSYWWLRGIRREGAEAGLRLLRTLGDVIPPDLDEEYVTAVALVALGSQDVPELPSLMERADRVLQSIDRPLRQPFLLAMWALAAGPPDGAEDHEKTAELRAGQLTGQRWNQALVLLGSAYLQLFAGRPELAEPYLNRSLADFRALGERWGITQALDALAGIALQTGDPQRALMLLDEALHLVRELGSVNDAAEMLHRRGDVLLALGRLDQARDSFLAAADEARLAGTHNTGVAARCGLGDVARLEGEATTAAAHYEGALADCPPRWYTSEIRARALLGLARLAHARNDRTTSLAHARAAADAARDYRMNHTLTEEITRFSASLSTPSTNSSAESHRRRRGRGTGP